MVLADVELVWFAGLVPFVVVFIVVLEACELLVVELVVELVLVELELEEPLVVELVVELVLVELVVPLVGVFVAGAGVGAGVGAGGFLALSFSDDVVWIKSRL